MKYNVFLFGFGTVPATIHFLSCFWYSGIGDDAGGRVRMNQLGANEAAVRDGLARDIVLGELVDGEVRVAPLTDGLMNAPFAR